MHAAIPRAAAGLALLAAGVLGGGVAVGAAARHAAQVDLVNVAAGSLGRDGRPASVRLPIRADMLGASWRGPGDAIELRAQGSDGSWSRWVELHAAADGPDPNSREARVATRRIGTRRTASNPIWVGDAARVQVRAHEGEHVRDVRVVAINATGTATAVERAAGRIQRGAAWVLGGAHPRAEARPLLPLVQRRAAWQAAPPRAQAAYADDTGVLGAVVHHTAGTNRYSCAQVPALLRGIQRYHMASNGWNDIGYNYLVDACGGVWEGRAGGLARPVIGAHTAGFNTSTTGIALIGNHAWVRPTPAARNALQKLLAWRLDVAHVRPTGLVPLTARTGDKYPVGSRVMARAVSGHRDLFPTSCPGAMGYRELRRLAVGAWLSGGAKVVDIRREHELANPEDSLDPSLASVRVRARGSSTRVYLTLRLERISNGELLHEAAAPRGALDSTWSVPEGVRVPAWDVRVVVNGATAVQRARGALLPLVAVPADPGLVVTTPPPATVAPGGDPADDLVRLEYTLALQYRLGAWLHDPATGEQVATLFEPRYVGTTQVPRPLELAIPAHVADGTYELRVGLPADPAAGRSMRTFPLTVDRA